jgi:histidinol-phosphate/aromatic aminotransferase/cobyric acid decarboxylase-like protein
VNTERASESRSLGIFDTRFHNPSFFAVRENVRFAGPIVDYCVPANTYFPPPEMVRRIQEDFFDSLKYYPDYAQVHQDNICALTGTPAENIVAGNGVTELITLMCRDAHAPVLTSIPTFGRWTDLPQEFGVSLCYLERRLERQFRLTVDEIVQRVGETGARTLVISNPNNPTGAWLTHAEIARLFDALCDLPLIAIDESFIDFSGIESAERLAVDARNVVVLKSMGKAIGWHGVRLGYAVANAQLAKKLRSKVPYWNINGLAASVLKHAVEFKVEYRSSFAKVAEDREYMYQRMQSVPSLVTYPSKANFLFTKLPDGVSGRRVRDALLENHGLFVRECSNKVGSTENYLRCVVRKRPDSDRLVEALRDLLAG